MIATSKVGKVLAFNVTNRDRWGSNRSARLASSYPFDALQVADVADDGVDLGGFDVGYRRHVAEVPVVRDHAFVNGVVEGEVGMMSNFVEAVYKGWSGLGAVGLLSVTDCASVLE